MSSIIFSTIIPFWQYLPVNTITDASKNKQAIRTAQSPKNLTERKHWMFTCDQTKKSEFKKYNMKPSVLCHYPASRQTWLQDLKIFADSSMTPGSLFRLG